MSKNAGKIDTYQHWKEAGKLDEVLEFIKKSVTHLATQNDIAKELGLTPQAVIKLRKKYKDLDDAFITSKVNLKTDLLGGMMKLALGYEEITETQDITDGGPNGTKKKKVNRVKKQVGPSYKAIIYLLTKHFGSEYSDKFDELKIMEKRLVLQEKEEWSNGQSTNSTNETEGFDTVSE